MKKSTDVVLAVGGTLVDEISVNRLGTIVICDVSTPEKCIFDKNKQTKRRAVYNNHIVAVHAKNVGKLPAYFKGLQA